MVDPRESLDLERLRKILDLERSRGCADTAVSGGLDRFLARFAALHPGTVRLPAPSYKALTSAERRKWIEGALRIFSADDRNAPSPPEPRKRPARALSLDAPITAVRGIHAKTAPKFHKLGLNTVRDLLYFFPRRYMDYRSPVPIADLEPGIEQTALVKVWQAANRKTRRGMVITELTVGDSTGTMKAVFFNQPFLAEKFVPNSRVILSGRLSIYKGSRVFQPVSYEMADDALAEGHLVPVYSLTEGLYPRYVRRVIKEALDSLLPALPDFLPEEIRQRAGLISLSEAIRQIHYPDDNRSIDAARRRLAFDELFLIQVGVLAKRRERLEGATGIRLDAPPEYVRQFVDSLPFRLTRSQVKALDEILSDLRSDRPMSRLLHGDVGSGKTVVAAAAMLHAIASGAQAALMVPTEILAEQHFRNIRRLLGSGEGEGIVCSVPSAIGRPITLGLLTGSIRQKGKRELYRQIAGGQVDVVIGTQALIQEQVNFGRLGLVVVDEQHRFGVMQRMALRQKGVSPHMLVMSATPIPRTLALTLYGDLDISLIEELPPGRQRIKTRWLGPGERRSGYEFVRGQVAEGRQAYVICPLIEESEAVEARAATSEYERLSKEIFPDLRLGLLHGRMGAREKDEIMRRFREREIDILVSTSVVEVGIDVPNATVVLIEGADRFGLSQLHQFRGRVWRSDHQSYCLLLAENPSPEGRERLQTMEKSDNGFVLAEKDLEMRGPGDFFGTRQSGLPDLKMARLTDVALLETARREAVHLFESDPGLKKAEHRALAAEVSRLWERTDAPG